MIKKIFWLVLGAVLAAVGLNFLKKKASENPQQFSTDALVERFIGIFSVVKEYIQAFWKGYSEGQTLNDGELERIFVNETEFEPKFDTAIKPSDISLN